jgi:NitT/TauT family transport system substrate-binding protein
MEGVRILLISRGAALSLLAGGSLGTMLPARALAASQVIRVLEVPVDTALELSYGQQSGLIEQAGLTVDVNFLAFGAAVESAVLGGSADVGNSNISSLAAAQEKGLPIVLVASGAVYNAKEPSSALMVANDSPIHTARDLNGKTVAVNGLQSVSQLGPQAWIDKNGGDSKTVHWVDMPFVQMAGALATNRIDAAIIAEPALTRAKKDARVLADAYDAIAPRFLVTAWFASAAWVSSNAALARKFADTIYRIGAWANTHRAQTAEVLAKSGHLDPGLIQRMTRTTFAESYDPSLLKPQLDMALKYGVIAKPISPEDMFAPEVRH